MFKPWFQPWFQPRSLAFLILSFILGWNVCASGTAESIHPLAQHPALSKDKIAFRFADDLWIVGRAGGEAQRLTATGAVKAGPFFSPDGRWLAYSALFDGNLDVYLVPSGGGQARRLTYHPQRDEVVGWTPDSTAVLFSSPRADRRDIDRLFSVGVDGVGLPQALPMQSAAYGAISPDGRSIAYVPYFQWQRAWKRYRGGQTTPIWIADLKTLATVKVPRDNSNDSTPMWADGKLYFLSDRDGPVALFSYDPSSRRVDAGVANRGLDFKSAAAGPGGIVYEQFGDLHVYDFASRHEQGVPITISSDLPELRPHLLHPDPKSIHNVALSPSGERLAIEARGDIFTVPREKGDVRNLTNSPGAADRDPGWSPNGKYVAYFSDRSGEYALYLEDQSGLGPVKKIGLGEPPSFFYSPQWSPDSKHIAYTDKRLNLWYVDVDGGAPAKPVKVDTDYSEIETSLGPVWSPDSKWIAYAKDLPNNMHAIYLYSLTSGKSTQLTDGMSDALHPAFDRGGKYLYFTASTDTGPAADGFDLSAENQPVTSNVYLVVLAKDQPSPLQPESDEEKVKDDSGSASAKKDDTDGKKDGSGDEKKGGKSAKVPEVKIEFDGILQRILALPMPARNYVDLEAGKEGILYATEGSVEAVPDNPAEVQGFTVHRLDLKARKEEEVLHGVALFAVSADGSRVAYKLRDQFFIADDGDLKPESASPGKQLDLAGMLAMSDPRAEWAQMYHETWRIERDFFYDPHYHGLDLRRAESEYKPYLERLGSRSALDSLFEEMLGNLTVGHMFVVPPRPPDPGISPTGLLGADYETADGRYRFARVFDGENWNPDLHAPLTQPGVNVQAGEYLLAVNGRELHATDNLYSFFIGMADHQIILRVGPKSDGSGARDVTVIPIGDEEGLRTRAWIEDNRRTVDRLSHGQIAYVYLPDTADGGYTYFNRYFFAQVGKEGVIVDERFNHGGLLANYVIDVLLRQREAFTIPRNGAVSAEPGGAIFGPKVMITNQMAGSGGDALPWLFRKENVGKLIGTRTWGGLVGIGGYPPLLDGGMVMAPRMGIYGTSGKFEVENRGVAPDIEVEMTPQQSQNGSDPQLEKAIQIVMEELAAHPIPAVPRPAFPDYHQQSGR